MFIFVKLNKYAWGAKLRESLFLLWFYLEKSIMNFIFLLISHYNVYTVWLMLINDVLKCCKTYWLNVPHSNSIFMYSSLLYYSHWYTMILYIAVLFFKFYSFIGPPFWQNVKVWHLSEKAVAKQFYRCICLSEWGHRRPNPSAIAIRWEKLKELSL